MKIYFLNFFLSQIKKLLVAFFGLTISIFNFLFPNISIKKTVITALHSFWLIAASLLWLGHANIMDGFGFMNDYINLRTFVNQVVLQKPPPPNIAENFLLINTSRNNQIVSLDNDNITNTIITDRRVLAEKLKILDENSEKIAFVLCDIFFDIYSDDNEADSLLQSVIIKLSEKNKFAMPAYFNDKENVIIEPIFSGNYGLSQYRSSYLNKQFLKYSFITYNQYLQLPLIAYQNVYGKKLEKKSFAFVNYYMTSGRLSLNTIIPAFRYTQANLVEGTNYFHLGLFEDYYIREGQVVIIGDFEGKSDVHHTIADLSSGALILLNIYSAIANGDNIVSFYYLIFLFIVFFYVSYHSFFYKYKIKHRATKFGKIMVVIANKINYFILILLVYFSMIFFSHYIHFLILLTYFAIVDFFKLLMKRKSNGLRYKSV